MWPRVFMDRYADVVGLSIRELAGCALTNTI
jgi:hypothetical protein